MPRGYGTIAGDWCWRWLNFTGIMRAGTQLYSSGVGAIGIGHYRSSTADVQAGR
jgi:hypothetical protein